MSPKPISPALEDPIPGGADVPSRSRMWSLSRGDRRALTRVVGACLLGAVPGIYSSLAVAIGVFFAPESVGREFLAVTPAFAAAGLVGPPGAMGEALRLFSLGLLLLFLFALVTGRFVG